MHTRHDPNGLTGPYNSTQINKQIYRVNMLSLISPNQSIFYGYSAETVQNYRFQVDIQEVNYVVLWSDKLSMWVILCHLQETRDRRDSRRKKREI